MKHSPFRTSVQAGQPNAHMEGMGLGPGSAPARTRPASVRDEVELTDTRAVRGARTVRSRRRLRSGRDLGLDRWRLVQERPTTNRQPPEHEVGPDAFALPARQLDEQSSAGWDRHPPWSRYRPALQASSRPWVMPVPPRCMSVGLFLFTWNNGTPNREVPRLASGPPHSTE